MPQQMNVLRCCSCKMYQVHMIKQAKKWQCKVCNHKQIFKNVYFRGLAKDCRICVQKLNLMKADNSQTTEFFHSDSYVTDDYSASYPNQSNSEKVENKWAKYLDTSENTEFQTSKFLNSESNSCENNDEPRYSHDDSTANACSQNEYVYTDNSYSYENDSEQDPCNNKEEYDNVEQNEVFDNTNNSDNDSQNYNKKVIADKSTKSIFDDNEDFDVSIDF